MAKKNIIYDIREITTCSSCSGYRRYIESYNDKTDNSDTLHYCGKLEKIIMRGLFSDISSIPDFCPELDHAKNMRGALSKV